MVKLNVRFSDGEEYIKPLESRELSVSPKLTITRAITTKGVIFNFIEDDDGQIEVRSNYGFVLSGDNLSTNFNKPNPDFVDKF